MQVHERECWVGFDLAFAFLLVTFAVYVGEYSVKHARLKVSPDQFRDRLVVNWSCGHFENVLEIDFLLQKDDPMVQLDGRTGKCDSNRQWIRKWHT